MSIRFLFDARRCCSPSLCCILHVLAPVEAYAPWVSSTILEFQRLRADFEREASRYTGLKLPIVMIPADLAQPGTFERPNHLIMLWQYLGRLSAVSTRPSLAPNSFGVPDAEITAFGLLEGADTDLFRRMAARGGSILPPDDVAALMADLETALDDRDLPGKPVFAANHDPLSRWISFVLASTWKHENGRISGRNFRVDPFVASLSAIDNFLAKVAATVAPSPPAPTTSGLRRFAVALSLPGEQRDYVQQVADGLRPRVSVFYDRFFAAELARPDLDLYLQDIYRNQSDLLVIFLCAEYEKKDWCGIEWRAIRDLLKNRERDRIMFMRFDDAVVPGVFSIDGSVDLRNTTPVEANDMICQRVTMLRAKTSPGGEPSV